MVRRPPELQEALGRRVAEIATLAGRVRGENNSADAKRLLLVGVQAVDLVVHRAEAGVDPPIHPVKEGVVERD